MIPALSRMEKHMKYIVRLSLQHDGVEYFAGDEVDESVFRGTFADAEQTKPLKSAADQIAELRASKTILLPAEAMPAEVVSQTMEELRAQVAAAEARAMSAEASLQDKLAALETPEAKPAKK